MRYRISIYPILDAYQVIIAGYRDNETEERLDFWSLVIEPQDLKVDDLQHILENIYMRVSESTP